MIQSSPDKIKEYTGNGWWGEQTVIDLFEKSVERFPDAMALVDPLDREQFFAGSVQRLTYRELDQKVNRLAGSLLSAGLKKDDIILMQLPNLVELVMVYLATSKIGAIVSPVPVQFRTHELNYILSILQPKAIITVGQFDGFNYAEMFKDLQIKYPHVHTIIGLGRDLPQGVLAFDMLLDNAVADRIPAKYVAENPNDANDVFTICWTSGAEPNPKGVPRSYNHWITIANAMVDGVPIDRESCLMNAFPLVAMAGIGGMLVPWLLTGCKLVLHHPLSVPVLLQQIKVEQIDFTMLPPAVLKKMLQNEDLLASADLSSIKAIGSGSAPLSPWMVSGWQKRGIVIINIFASNEGTCLFSTLQDCPDPVDRARNFPRFGAPGFTWNNRLLGGMQTKLVDPQTAQEITASEKIGELLIKGPSIFEGYYQRPDLTEKVFDKDGFYKTGDLFTIAGEGNILNRYRFVGRLKDFIIAGGFNVAPKELENLIMGHSKVAEVAVVGLPGEYGDRICAVIVAKENQTVSIAELRDYLNAKDIAAYKIPKRVIGLPALPRNPTGKVVKREVLQKIKEMDLIEERAADA